jgi:hypothetical protein
MLMSFWVKLNVLHTLWSRNQKYHHTFGRTARLLSRSGMFYIHRKMNRETQTETKNLKRKRERGRGRGRERDLRFDLVYDIVCLNKQAISFRRNMLPPSSEQNRTSDRDLEATIDLTSLVAIHSHECCILHVIQTTFI